MNRLSERPKPTLHLAAILREHLKDYQNSYPLSPDQHRIVSHLINCRTPNLGGHLHRCTHCGAERIRYHSCRNRHCPTCQHLPRERWIEARKSELLPTSYFHIVFTLPHELNPLILKNKSLVLSILFKAVAKTLITFGENKLGGKLGFVAVLHTWDQQLKSHFHLHCLVAGGAVCSKTKRWVSGNHSYLFNQEALSLVFRGKFIHALTRAIRRGKLDVDGPYQQFKATLYKHTWVVSVRKPIKEPQHVLEYLARYTHRVAIANARLTALEDGTVSFRYKDRKNNSLKTATISAVEFIRRFLLHSLPAGFVRIRHYGFLANRNRTANLNSIRRLLQLPSQLLKTSSSLQQLMAKLTGIDITRCPCCRKGTMCLIAHIPRHRPQHPHGLIRPPNLLTAPIG
jgi:hypothetical protein